MRTATITEAKNGLSALIDHVKSGESVLILDRGVPVARLEPAAGGSNRDGRIARLERAGTVRSARTPPPTELLSCRPPVPKGGASAVDALVEERRSGR